MKMSQWLKVFAIKSNDLSSFWIRNTPLINRAEIEEKKNLKEKSIKDADCKDNS